MSPNVLAGTWTWTDAWMFIGVVLAIRVAFFWLVTKAFVLMIPDGDQCVLCKSVTPHGGDDGLPAQIVSGWFGVD